MEEFILPKSRPEAYELLLIEKAIGKKSGEAFEELYGDDNNTRII